MEFETPHNKVSIFSNYLVMFSQWRFSVIHFFQNIKNRLQPLSVKKLTASFSPLLLVVIVVEILIPHPAHAVLAWVIDLAGYMWAYFFYAIQTILIMFLAIVSYIVDNLFWYNVILNPTNMPAVKSGWVIMRDIANGLFLLLIVYIAIQIIWGIGQNDKRLLVRVIIIAFLINFSLAITGAVFGFGNALARPFQKALSSDVAGFIVEKTRISTIQLESTPQQVKDATAFADAQITGGKCPLMGMTDFQAGAGCVMGTAVTKVIGALGGVINANVLNRDSVRDAVTAGIACVFLVLIVLMYCGVAGFLIVRIVMMAFLGAVSAGAFFLSAIPHAGTKKLWNDWLQAVVGWAFIAPVFYFLFYLSLIMLDAMTKIPMVPEGKISFTANLFAMLPFVIFLFFIKTTMNICKKMGGKIAEAAIAMGQKVGGIALGAAAGIATGGASLALGAVGGATARGMQHRVEGGMEKLAGVPVLGKLTAPITNRVRGYYQQRNAEIDKQKGEHASTSSRDLVQQLKTTLSTDKKVAIAEVLHQRGDFDKIKDKTIQDKVVGYSNQFGRENLLTARPDLATKDNVYGLPDGASKADAQKKVLEKMTKEQKVNISSNAINDNTVKDVFLRTANVGDIQHMVKKNADMTEKIIYEYFDDVMNKDNKALREALQRDNPEVFNFIKSNMKIQTGRNKKYEADFAALEKKEEEEAKKKAGPTPPPPPTP